MSTRANLKPNVVIPSPKGNPANGSSMAGNITSAPTILDNLSRVSYSLSWTGSTPVGAASVQASNDYSLNPDGTVLNSGTWTTMFFSYNGTVVSSVPVTGNTGTGIFDITITSIYAIRLVYTATSGTGTLQAIVKAGVS